MKKLRIILLVLLSATAALSAFMLVRYVAGRSQSVDEVLCEKFGENTPTESEARLFELINAEREKEGLKPYRFETGLHSLSLLRAKEAKALWSHTRPDGRGYGTVIEDCELEGFFKCVGENLGKNFEDADEIHASLMNSPDHRKNILSEEYDGVSIAVFCDEDGNNYLCQTFVKRR